MNVKNLVIKNKKRIARVIVTTGVVTLIGIGVKKVVGIKSENDCLFEDEDEDNEEIAED